MKYDFNALKWIIKKYLFLQERTNFGPSGVRALPLGIAAEGSVHY
jgi:hypothetical protein